MSTETESRFNLTPEGRACREFLRKVSVGQLITYKTLREACGVTEAMKDETAFRNFVARHHRALQTEALVFEPEPGVGIRRLDDKGIVGRGQMLSRKIRNATRKAAKELSAVSPDNLDRDTRAKYELQSVTLNLVAMTTAPKAQRKIEQLAHGGKVSPADALKQLLDSSNN